MDSLIGTVINNSYEIIGELARGGMATVYRARQISMDRDVAIKVLPPEFLHEVTFLERFKQEVEIASRLAHRGIVPVYDHGDWNGVPYIVMRYMEGLSLDNLMLQTGIVPLEQTQQIIRQVASALDYAHRQGVLHRDLKPSNILLDQNGDAYITDFGIARIATKSSQLTSTGVVGTPSYMSPEQAQGLPLDGRSDVYALGVVLFEMLTGQRPFEGESPYSVAILQVTQNPPNPAEFNPSISESIQQVVLKALEKNPKMRFQTATELAGALDDADLFPMGMTIQREIPRRSDPNSITPKRVMSPVSPHSPISPLQPISHAIPRRRRPLPTVMALAVVTGLALLIGGLILGAYVVIANGEDTPQTNPQSIDFAATGIAKLTATADQPQTRALFDEGRMIYQARRDAQSDLYMLNFATRNETRLTHTSGIEQAQTISPDQSQIAYLFSPAANTDPSQIEIYIRHLDESNPQPITSNLKEEISPVWTPDNQGIIYAQSTADPTTYRIIRYNLETAREETLFESQGRIGALSLSPNGAQIVFSLTAPDSSQSDLFILTLPTGELRQLTDSAPASASHPVWLPTQNRIVFRLDDNTISAINSDGTEQQTIYQGDSLIEFLGLQLPDEQILFSTDNTIFLLDGSTPQTLVQNASAPLWIQ